MNQCEWEIQRNVDWLRAKHRFVCSMGNNSGPKVAALENNNPSQLSWWTRQWVLNQKEVEKGIEPSEWQHPRQHQRWQLDLLKAIKFETVGMISS